MKDKNVNRPVSRQMNRNVVICATHQEYEELDNRYWANKSGIEKIQMVTFLREYVWQNRYYRKISKILSNV